MKALYFDNNIAKILALKVSSVFNKNAALGSLAPMRFAEVPDPKLPGPRWLKVRNRACGLCGTDLHLMFMDLDPGCFPAAMPGLERKYLGHEAVGEVVELGDEVAGFKVGDRVAIRIDWPSCFQMEIDPPCQQCAAGNYMLCMNLGQKPLPDGAIGGGFSPMMVLHRTQPYKIPDAVTEDRALLLEPTATSLHGVLKRRPLAGEKVLVVGAGTIGLLTAAVAKAIQPEARVHVIARHSFQKQAAARMGADEVIDGGPRLYQRLADLTGARYHKGHFGNEILLGGFDLIYDTVGSDRTLTDSLRWVRAGGAVVLQGINFQPGKIDYTPIWNQEIQLLGINSHADENPKENSFDLAAKLLVRRDFPPVEELITHRFALDDYKEAIRTFRNKKRTGAIKIVLEHGESI